MMWEDLAARVQIIHAQPVLPIHHDSIQVKGEEARREWVKKPNDYRIKHGSVSRSAYPEKHKWFNLAVSISLSD
jgi:hypothetical protein